MKKYLFILSIFGLICICFLAFNTSVYAASSYTVTFDIFNGKRIKKVKVKKNKKVSKPSNPTRSGYTFSGWYTSNSYKTKYNFNNKVKSNFTLYAKWTKKKYTVSFNTDGGSSVNSKIVYYDSQVTKPNNPTKSGYVFGGWYKDLDYVSKYSFLTKVKKNMTLYALWLLPAEVTNTHDLTFVTNAGIDPFIIEVENGSAIDEVTFDLGIDNFGSAEWFTDSLLTTRFDLTTPIYKDMVLYGRVYDVSGAEIIETPDTFSRTQVLYSIAGVMLFALSAFVFYDYSKKKKLVKSVE